MTETDYPVIIIGGGPCGLLTSLLLARFGVKNLVLERHPDISIHPKAMGITRRTGEIYRQLGLYDRMCAADVFSPGCELSIWAKSLVGEELGRTPLRRVGTAYSPCRRFHCPQPHTEAVIARAMQSEAKCELRHYVEVTDTAQEGDRVRVGWQDRDSGETGELTARYLVAADGVRSPVRERLGIETDGPGDLGHYLNVYFRANYGPHLAGRHAILYQALSERFFEFFVTVNGHDLWLMHHHLQPGESAGDYPESRVLELIKAASGMPEEPVEIISVLPWVMSPRLARVWRAGRIFLTGDAAARLSPSGGLGMNTGLQSAHNLAWKLAAVIHDLAGDALLDSYADERVAVARNASESSNENFMEIYSIVECALRGDWDQARAGIAHSRRAGSILGQDLGQFYTRGAWVGDGSSRLEPADPVNDYAPSGHPGGRAPHVWLGSGGVRVSTLDYFGRGFAVLAGSEGLGWQAALTDSRWPLAAPLKAKFIAVGRTVGDPGGQFLKLYGIEPDGCVLVRPDGYIGARFASLARSGPGALVDAARAMMGLAD